jgi:RHS repeat-associated protein
LLFPGQYLDAETGLAENLHRYYDPDTARYTSQDPLGLAPAPNPVTYVHNPLTWADPLGLNPCSAPLPGGGAQKAPPSGPDPNTLTPAGESRFVAGRRGVIDTQHPALINQVNDVADHLASSGSPPTGVWQGGASGHQPGTWLNAQERLPERPLGHYTESDVWPGSPGSRGAERIVMGRTGEMYYSPDHYGTFRQFR